MPSCHIRSAAAALVFIVCIAPESRAQQPLDITITPLRRPTSSERVGSTVMLAILRWARSTRAVMRLSNVLHRLDSVHSHCLKRFVLNAMR